MNDPKHETDYVLGTHDEEIARLGLQHRVWRARVLECWRRAGITIGSCVMDVGCGPGYATADLAEIVGPSGEIFAVERSERFLNFNRQRCTALGLTNVKFREVDLMEDSLGSGNFDAAWCRWVACFVSSPEKLVREIAGALRPGGVAIFHEYSDYRTFKLAPRRPAQESFVDEVMASWRANGGEPNIGLALPALFQKAGLRLIEVRPHVLTVRPDEFEWQWAASFIGINLDRLRELGRVTADWTESVRREFAEAEADPETILTTPLFLELIARKE
jgi:SAM-dependent methyltransferase